MVQNIYFQSHGGQKCGGKSPRGQKTGGQKPGGQKTWGAKGRGAKDQGANDRGAKVLEPLMSPVSEHIFVYCNRVRWVHVQLLVLQEQVSVQMHTGVPK